MLALYKACLICRCLLKFIRNSILKNLTEIMRQFITSKFNRQLENDYMIVNVNSCARTFHVRRKATTEKTDYGSREKVSHLSSCIRLFSSLIFSSFLIYRRATLWLLDSKTGVSGTEQEPGKYRIKSLPVCENSVHSCKALFHGFFPSSVRKDFAAFQSDRESCFSAALPLSWESVKKNTACTSVN